LKDHSTGAAVALAKVDPKSNRPRPAKRICGSGIVTTGRGKKINVAYQLCFPQDDSGAAPSAAISPAAARLKEFSGQVWCPYDGSFVSVHQGQVMTLSMEDGRRLRFFHRNRDGGIAVTEWLR
jgi:hypothetical protein